MSGGACVWRYRYTCRYCDECFPDGAFTSHEAFETEQQAMDAAKSAIGDAPWDYWAAMD